MKFIFKIFLLSFFIFSCAKKNEKPLINERVSAFLNINKNVVLFGKVELNSLLNKSDIKKVPKIGLLLNSVLDEFKSTIILENPMYYASEGPFDTKGIPSSFYTFISIKNSDSLVLNLTKKGYDFNEYEGFKYAEFGKFSLGVENDLAIVVFKQEEYNSRDILNLAFSNTKGKLANDLVNKMLLAKGDVSASINLNALYSTSNTELEKLSEEKRKEIKSLVKNSYIQTSVEFNDGEVIIDSKNYFSDQLKNKLFFKTDKNAVLLSKLGNGTPRLALTLNVDINKLENFINDYSPGFFNKIGNELGGPLQMVLMMGGDNPLSGLFNGELGFSLFGNPQLNGGFIPDFTVFLGLGDKGDSIADLVKPFLTNGTMKTKIDSRSIFCSSSEKYFPQIPKKISSPFGFESFGKKSITGFANFEGMDMSSFELEGGAKIITEIKYITFEVDSSGFIIHIKAKNQKDNILKETLNFFLEEYKSQISNLPI